MKTPRYRENKQLIYPVSTQLKFESRLNSKFTTIHHTIPGLTLIQQNHVPLPLLIEYIRLHKNVIKFFLYLL